MTLSQSDLLEFLDAIRAGGDTDAIRQGAEFLYQALIEAEATETIGAARYERSGDTGPGRCRPRPATWS
jgi:putative transposase